MNRAVLSWIILSAALLTSAGILYSHYKESLPCTEPIPYAVGLVDKRFNLSQVALTESMQKAAEIWNKAAGRELLVYDSEAELKVHLVYDEREQNAQLGARILAEQERQEAARARLDTLQAQFEREQEAYNTKVAAINARGGAKPHEAAALTEERSALEALAGSVNAQVRIFNQSVQLLNEAIAAYNKTAGRAFEAGQYVRDAAGERINIFMFTNTDQLTRVLAHEFGHALGLGHNEDPMAIMYAQNESGNLAPTEADLAALTALCNLK